MSGLDRPASRRTGAARRLRGMNPRPRDFIGAAVLAIVLFAIIATPGGDPLSSTVLSLVMYALFEGTLQLIRKLRP